MKLVTVKKIMFFICDVVSLFTVLVKTGFVDWFDKWNIFPIFITLAYDNFPEVDKDKCVGLKIVSEVDKAKCFGLKIMRTNLSSNLIPEVYLFPWHYITQGKGFPLALSTTM